MSQPGLARAAAGAPRDVSGLLPLSGLSIAFAVKATAGKLPPIEGGATPCGAGAEAKPLHHVHALVGPHCVAPSPASSYSATVREAAHTCFKNLLNKIYIDKKLIDNSFIL